MRPLDIAEFEIVARQHVTRPEALLAVPMVVARVMAEACCPNCSPESEPVMVIDKDREKRPITDPQATIGFAIARPYVTTTPTLTIQPAVNGENKNRISCASLTQQRPHNCQAGAQG